MKKVLSILLSVMMVAGLFVALIPTATAAYSIPTEIPEVEKGELIYSQDFESAQTALTNNDLAASLNWTGNVLSLSIVNDEDVTSIQDEAIYGAISEWQKEGNARLRVSGGAGYGGPTILVDDRLAGGDYILEYTAIMIDNTSGDGQGLGFASSGFPSNSASGSANNYYTIWKTAMKERGDFDVHTYYSSSSSTALLSSADFDTSTRPSAGASDTNTRGSLINLELRIRVTVDADFGWYISIYDADLDSWVVWASVVNDAAKVQQWQSKAPYIGNSIMMRLLGGPVMLVDDIQVWTIDKSNYTPSELAGDAFVYPNADNSELSEDALVITTVNTDALPTTKNYDVITGHPNPNQTTYKDAEGNLVGEILKNDDGSYKYAPDGVKDNLRFEYVEVYNASTSAKNIYNYGIVIANSVEKDYLTATVSGKGKACEIEPGYNKATSSNNTWGYEYVNPAFEDGWLEPGESAILMIPNNWWNADCTVGTNESFRRVYLEQVLGMTTEQADAVKVFTIAYPTAGMGINNSGTVLVGMIPLVDDSIPSAYLSGKVLDQTYLESYVVANMSSGKTHGFASSADGSGSVTAIVGYNGETDYYAANFDHWDDDGNYIPVGIRSDNSLTKETTTPGTVALENRRPFNVTYMVDGDVYKTEVAYLATAYDLAVSPTKAGYTFAGWADAEGNVVTSVAAADMTSDKTFTATWVKNNEVQWVGFQAAVAEGDRYDLRLVGSVVELDDIKNIAFSISVNGTAEQTVYLKYVYKSITTDFGEATFQVPNDGYVVVLEINNCRVDADIVVKAVTVYEDGTTATGAAANVEYPY